MQAQQAKKFLVSGRVQGVFFRESTRREAQHLGIQGSATNLEDGRVEVLAWGAESALDLLHAWLHTGPTMARVTNVEPLPLDGEPPQGFTTG